MTSFISFVIAAVVLIYATYRNGDILESISESAYLIPSWAFSIWIAIIGILMMPGVIDALPEKYRWIGFLSILGLFGVAASPYYRTESKLLHYGGGIICFISSTIITFILQPFLLLFWVIAIPIFYTKNKSWLFFCEIICFVMLLISVLL